MAADVRAVIAEVAQSGVVRHDWRHVRPVLLHLLREAFALLPSVPLPAAREADVPYLEAALQSFDAAPPFTVQRLCELLLQPTAQYRSKEKLARALETLLSVSSTAPTGEAARRQEALGVAAAEQRRKRRVADEGPAMPEGAPGESPPEQRLRREQ